MRVHHFSPHPRALLGRVSQLSPTRTLELWRCETFLPTHALDSAEFRNSARRARLSRPLSSLLSPVRALCWAKSLDSARRERLDGGGPRLFPHTRALYWAESHDSPLAERLSPKGRPLKGQAGGCVLIRCVGSSQSACPGTISAPAKHSSRPTPRAGTGRFLAPTSLLIYTLGRRPYKVAP